MKCLTVRQPYAWLLVNGYKDIENRSWKTKHRGPVLIHAAMSKAPDYENVCKDLRRRFRINIPDNLPTGRIVGMVTISDCVTKSRSRWFFGPVGFVCTKARRLPFFPMKGKLGLFEVGPRIARRVTKKRR